LPAATRHSDAVMKNLVGPDEIALWPAILATPGLIPHLYGKSDARPGRKMGHVTRLFPKGSLPGEFGIEAALGPAAPRRTGEDSSPSEAVNQLAIGVSMLHQSAEKNRGGPSSGTKLLGTTSRQKKRIRGAERFSGNRFFHKLSP
jgi:hypothetical protein